MFSIFYWELLRVVLVFGFFWVFCVLMLFLFSFGGGVDFVSWNWIDFGLFICLMGVGVFIMGS